MNTRELQKASVPDKLRMGFTLNADFAGRLLGTGLEVFPQPETSLLSLYDAKPTT